MSFVVGDRVKVSAHGITIGNPPRIGGIVRYVACHLATGAGGRTCDKKHCKHVVKDYVWVEWDNNGKIFSYHHTELELDGAKVATVIPDAASFKTKMAKVSEKLKKAEESVALGADNFRNKDVDWDKYNFNRAPIVQRSREPIINEDEIDWSAYNGYKRGAKTVRKRIVVN